MTKKTPTTPPKEKEPALNTNLQLSFDVFKELDAKGMRIEQSKKEIGFRKNNLLITMNDLSLDQKRVIDVIFFIASQGLDTYSEHRDYVRRTRDGLYEVDLSFFKWLLSLNNPRNQRLREVMASIQSVHIQAEELSDPTDKGYRADDKLKRWQTHNFFGSTLIDVPAGKAAFSINPIFERHIQQPTLFHFLSLRYVLPNLASKILYDWLLLAPSYDKPITLTVEQWLKAFGQDKKRSYQRFSEFNRSFLTPAIEGVNAATNLHVSYKTHRNEGSALITHMSLMVEKRNREEDEQAKFRHFIDQYRSLRDDFGLQDAHIEEILRHRNQWDDERIEQAKRYTLDRLQSGGVKSVSGYFMNALREGYRVSEIEMELKRGESTRLARLVSQNQEKPTPTLEVEAIEAPSAPKTTSKKSEKSLVRAQAGWTQFEVMDAAQRLACLDAFCTDPYIQFIAQAHRVDTQHPDQVFAAIHAHPRLKNEFGLFVLKRSEA